VHDAYRSWASATGPRDRNAFWQYTAALDAEESAAEVYASLVQRVGHLATSDDDLSGPLAAWAAWSKYLNRRSTRTSA
jgi:hypothetical protein